MSEKMHFRSACARLVSGAASILLALALSIGLSFTPAAQSSARAGESTGVISGQVTANKGDVRALRVQATDVTNLITYTVFTVGGGYHIYNLPASEYEVSVLEEEFSSPRITIELKAGERETADLKLDALPQWPQGKAKGRYEQQGKIVDLVDFDVLYPPGAGRDILERSCFGCHGTAYDNHWHRMPGKTKAEWAEAFKHMYDQEAYSNWHGIAGIASPPMLEYPLSDQDKDTVLNYFAANFGPNRPERDIKRDTVVRDEEALSKVLYVTYPVPPGRGTHDLFPSTELPGTIWGAAMPGSFIIAVDTSILDPNARYREWRIPEPKGGKVYPHGIVECKGNVYWTGMVDDTIGQMNIETGEISRYVMPTPGGGAHTPRADSNCNIWATQVYGKSRIVRLDAETKEFTEYTPVAGANWYGIVVDQQDRAWAASYGAPVVAMIDSDQNSPRIFELSHGARRITVAPNGMVWANQYFGNKLSKIDPETGEITDYELPVAHAAIYESISDSEGNMWAESQPYNGIFNLNPKLEEWTYYPFPILQGHTPKIEQDENGTFWFALGERWSGLKPNGNVPMGGS